MKSYLPYIVVGLASGSVYALAAMGLTVTYKTSGVFNFAHGAVGMIATYVFYTLRTDVGVSAGVAIGASVLVFAPTLGIAIDRVLLPRLRGATTSTYIVVSLGLLVALQGLAIRIYGGRTRTVEPFLPTGAFRLPGINVGWDQAILVLLAAACGLALWAFFHLTHLGLQLRAVVNDAELTELTGIDAHLLTTISWMIGSALAALSGILLAPLLGLDAAILTLLVVQAFGAAVVGRLTNLPLAYGGGILLGLAAAISTKLVAGIPYLAGIPSALPFILLFGVLLLSPKRHFKELVEVRERVDGRARQPRGIVTKSLLLLTVALPMPWLLPPAWVTTATTTLVFVLVFRSLGLLVGVSRQVSLAHAVFVGLGASTLANLLRAGLPFAPSFVLSVLIVVPIGALMAIPAIRLSPLFLALATFGFALLAEALIFPTNLAFGQNLLGISVARPSLFGLELRSESAYYFFVLAVVALCVASIEVLIRTRCGRILRALADSQVGAESLGLNPVVPRVIVFSLSTCMAAIAGQLFGSLFGSVNPISFGFFQSLVWLTVLVTAGTATLGGSVLAAFMFVTMPAILKSPTVNEMSPIFYGLMAIVMAQRPDGLIGAAKLVPTLFDFRARALNAAWRTRRSPLRERVEMARARAGNSNWPRPLSHRSESGAV